MSTRSSARSARRADADECAQAIAEIDARLTGSRPRDQELIHQWRSDADLRAACTLLNRAMNARTRFGQDRTPLPLPSGLPLPPV